MEAAVFDSAKLSAKWQRAFAEVERMVGGKVVRAERQERWRPAWYLDVERDGAVVPIYFRGDRGLGQTGIYTLAHEYRVMQVLAAKDVPVPTLYGYCEDPAGIVMARAEGRANLATADDEAERRAVLDHYIDLLAAMHAIDVAEFEAIGLRSPADARETALVDLPVWEKGYRQAKSRPEPRIEYMLGWLERNVPADRTRTTFIAGDAGQFLFEAGRVTAVIDLELACLGDPLADLGALRSRDISEPLGDLSRAFRRYAELTGERLDRRAIDFHTVRFGLNTPLACASIIAVPPPGVNYAQYLGWYLVYTRLPLEVIAAAEGVALEPPVVPSADYGAADPAHDALAAMLEVAAADDYDADAALRVAQYVRERARLSPALEADDLDEAAVLLGRRPRDLADADAGLEELVADGAALARLEAELLRYFYRRTLREEAMLRPAMRELTDVGFQKIEIEG